MLKFANVADGIKIVVHIKHIFNQAYSRFKASVISRPSALHTKKNKKIRLVKNYHDPHLNDISQMVEKE